MAATGERIADGAGARLRAHREQRRISLRELAARIGVSASTLSRVESGRRRPALELLVDLAELYGTTIDDLVTGEQLGDPLVNFRVIGHGPMAIVPLCKRAGGVNAFKVVLRPGTAAEEREAGGHEGWQWLVVLAGRLRLTLNGREFRLAAGEAAEFDTHVPHRFAAADERPVEYLVLYGAQGERFSLRVSTRKRAQSLPHRADTVRP